MSDISGTFLRDTENGGIAVYHQETFAQYVDDQLAGDELVTAIRKRRAANRWDSPPVPAPTAIAIALELARARETKFEERQHTTVRTVHGEHISARDRSALLEGFLEALLAADQQHLGGVLATLPEDDWQLLEETANSAVKQHRRVVPYEIRLVGVMRKNRRPDEVLSPEVVISAGLLLSAAFKTFVNAQTAGERQPVALEEASANGSRSRSANPPAWLSVVTAVDLARKINMADNDELDGDRNALQTDFAEALRSIDPQRRIGLLACLPDDEWELVRFAAHRRFGTDPETRVEVPRVQRDEMLTVGAFRSLLARDALNVEIAEDNLHFDFAPTM
jgi:hypothetical protein